MKLLLLVALFLSATTSFAKKPGPLCDMARAMIVEGDVIFISNHNYLFRRVEHDTNTWTSHVGVAFKDENNELVVYESTFPKSKITPVCEFFDRSFDDRAEVRRLSTPLTTSQIRVMQMAATRQLDISYDQGFDYTDSKTSFCSKFVYKTFQAVNIEVGFLQKFQEIADETPNQDLSFWNMWYLGNIPYDRITVTPAKQLLDPKFFTVFKNNVENY